MNNSDSDFLGDWQFLNFRKQSFLNPESSIAVLQTNVGRLDRKELRSENHATLYKAIKAFITTWTGPIITWTRSTRLETGTQKTAVPSRPWRHEAEKKVRTLDYFECNQESRNVSKYLMFLIMVPTNGKWNKTGYRYKQSWPWTSKTCAVPEVHCFGFRFE